MTKRESRKAEYQKQLAADRAYVNRDRTAEAIERIVSCIQLGKSEDAGFHAANLASRIFDRHPELAA